jgi:Protein of unknown function (DUF2637)
MTNYSADRGPRPADPLRLTALIAVIAGVVLLAAAAFVLSYAGIHGLALRAGVTPELARLYPLIFDAMLVVAGAAALALRGAGWWARFYAWATLLIVLVAVAVGDAIHATHVVLPIQPTRAVAAVLPWVFLLAAFGLLLEMLQHFRRLRAVNGQPGRVATEGAVVVGPAASHGNGGASGGNGAPGSTAQRGAVTWAAAGGGAGRALPPAPSGLDMLLGPRQGDPPAMPGPEQGGSTAAGEHQGQTARPNASHNPESVAYGEETGYVHPDSYLDHEDHTATARGGVSGPGAPDHPGHGDNPGQDHAAAGDRAPAADDGGPTADDGGPAADDGGPTAGDRTPATEDGAPANGKGSAGSGSAAQDGGKEAADQAKNDGAKDSQPAAANPAEATAQAAPAETAEAVPVEIKDLPAPDGDTAAPPPRSVMPLLERLRSTPAPPEE